jgi:hypothetical protein
MVLAAAVASTVGGARRRRSMVLIKYKKEHDGKLLKWLKAGRQFQSAYRRFPSDDSQKVLAVLAEECQGLVC